MREIWLKMAAVLKKNAPNPTTKTFLVAETISYSFALKISLSLPFRAYTLLQQARKAEDSKSSAKIFFVKSRQEFIKNAFFV